MKNASVFGTHAGYQFKKIWAHLRFHLCGQQLFRGFVIGKNYNNFGFSIKRAYKFELLRFKKIYQ